MIALKKLYGDELLRLALVLSLLKVDPNDYLEQETQQLLSGLHISNGSDWSAEQEARTLIRPRFVHPKSLDNILINYEREIFEELNSLGRYADFNLENNARIRVNPILHTYLVNNVATDTVVPPLAGQPVDEAGQDGVSADDNVAQEVKVSEEEDSQEQPEIQAQEPPRPDAVVTLSPDFLTNHTESDIFAEIATRSFDVNEFLVQPNMQIKKEPVDESEDLLDVKIKKEPQNEDLYSDNAMDDFVPYFTAKSEKFELGENSVFHQNMADLQDYGELFDDVKELRSDLDCIDVKQQQENLEQYLLENTPLDSEVYELAPMFEEELVLGVKRERASTSFTSASSSGVSEMDMSVKEDVKSEPDEGNHTGDELTQEDMDLIEVLWKQDVDMGFSIEDPVHPEGPQAKKVEYADEIDKELRAAEEKIQRKKEEEEIEQVKQTLLEPDVKEDDPWAGLSYTVDTETGEYVLQGELPRELVGESRFDLLEEALQLVELGDDVKDDPPEAVEGSSSAGAMLHPAMRHVPHHPLAHYHNQSLMRSMSVEQRWQDLASLLTIPPPPDQYQHYHQHPHHNISAHGAAGYAPNYHPHAPIPPMPDKHPDAYAGAAAPLEPSAYKVESAHHQQHDGLYYQNTTSEMAPPGNQDGFLQSILNDEDLQLMDMAMNEGMYTMRMLDGAAAHPAPHHNHSHMMVAERDSASDSAVSSMGSERVPSLSDGEWCDGSDSAQEFHSSKFRPYDSAYGRERAAPHQPQKKHHMFGKRCFQEQQQPTLEPLVPPRAPGVVKNEWPDHAYRPDNVHMHNPEFARGLAPPVPVPALDLNAPHSSHALLQSGVPSPAARFSYAAPERVRHNHTYSAPLQPDPRPAAARDKRVRRLTDGSMSDGGSSATSSGHLTRDEKRAKALGKSARGIPMEVHDIINLPMDEFNERLSKHDLSEAQLSLIRDIRRRGKNKVAAQNCRKRKLDQITSLADEVRAMRDRKARTARDHHSLQAERQRVKERFAALYRHVFQNLRDPEGRQLSSSQYSLQQAADGNVVLVPKMPQHPDHMNRTSDDEMDRKAKNFEQ
ncbi:endoplasmic reticulum membrane sensor NFE2L1-like isoform X1 [Pectinophora gossypiella]|uniref:endoplasmic reticulum membrane sensor NFE2L1-like isoform X1 n=1 Tax=Pectinophora gossypiella TaxID=13191 RepID=UPI00214E799A|nr:endoplasmic reticulum membrane sensor NFE2L1-like isoform X1 [Pectinophora gossypiella]XP_049884052.1 endoplasmic reticulum membrane sensor NFE2L1-like isoform X1 [Pectinophora gossypiella]XP_049884053.1 endoplasmic reticulum membrane sensor NFE2L1-like isoform X1 [Pectinophora gossypiella]XP_049884054.1 endoplasmic reticulum membrane sensor NFE2L1-like isoform X1 [Pectinophora gossypiella]XP_049884055.1 endoplasmic reticulum membrane sensor NFE2L1-like isoform X1 [Pectinophora gossypiella]